MPTASITQSNQTHAPPAVGVSLDVTYSEQGHFAPGKAAVTLCYPVNPNHRPLLWVEYTVFTGLLGQTVASLPVLSTARYTVDSPPV